MQAAWFSFRNNSVINNSPFQQRMLVRGYYFCQIAAGGPLKKEYSIRSISSCLSLKSLIFLIRI